MAKWNAPPPQNVSRNGAWHILSALIARRVLRLPLSVIPALSLFLISSEAVAPFYNFICNLSLFAFALGSFPFSRLPLEGW